VCLTWQLDDDDETRGDNLEEEMEEEAESSGEEFVAGTV